MRCIAQDVHDEHIFWVKLHGGKVRSTFNYRKHIHAMKERTFTKEEKAKIDKMGDYLLRKQEAIGRERTSNKN